MAEKMRLLEQNWKSKKYEFAYNPKISIIVPTYETPEMF